MKETEKKRGPNNNQTKRSTKSERRDNKLSEKNSGKTLQVKESDIKDSSARPEPVITLVTDSNTASEASEVYENIDIHYADDVQKSVEIEGKEKVEDHSSDAEEGMEGESETESTNDSVTSHGSVQSVEDVKNKRTPSIHKGVVKSDVLKGASKTPRLKSQEKMTKDTLKQVKNPSKTSSKGTVQHPNENPRSVKIHPKPLSESSEGVDDIQIEEIKESSDILNVALNNPSSVKSDDETVHGIGNTETEDKIGEMEDMIERLEEELREVAALEVSLYSVVPEHGSSAHKVHTPARRLSRLYLHACKHWSQGRRATVARNTISGLVLIARSCGNDVSRLTFWLSNSVVLREIISQAFGTSCQPNSLSKVFETKGEAKRSEFNSSSIKLKSNAGGMKEIRPDLLQFIDDWQQTRTFTAALEKVEAWIFSRVVESIWWQTLTPNMQAPSDDSSSKEASGRVLGPTLGDQQQGHFSIELWKNAFQDACRRLCPVRAGGHECGCLPVLARKVMEQCVRRLDVAMFNAILRESVHEIPSDPVSDPIVDSRVLPIPAGDLSFGSGAQLKNSVGNWSRCLDEFFGTETEISMEDDGKHSGFGPNCFPLLNELSDLLMLPKDMVMDRSVLTEVCPSIGLPLVKRILCNFSPDEFCPDSVPGAVLEALNAECIIERRLSRDSAINCFPCPAAPVAYLPPSSANVAEKVAEAGGNRQLSRNTSSIQKKGYTSDEELEELDSPLTSIVEKQPNGHNIRANGVGKERHNAGGNVRYELLREVWMPN